MNIAVRYQSRGGNTKAVAEAIAKAAASRAEPVGTPINGQADILFIGGGVYAFNIDESLLSFLKELKPETAKSVAVFSTGMITGGTGKITAILKSNGINVCEKTLPIKMGIKNCAFLGGKGSVKLSGKTLGAVDDFVKASIK